MTTTSGVLKGLAVVRAVATRADGSTAVAVANAVGINRSTAYRTCQMLVDAGWLTRLEDGGPARYTLGPSGHAFAVLVAEQFDTVQKVRPVIRALATSVGETVHVGALDGQHLTHIASAGPEDDTGIAAVRTGGREAIHVSALGRVILAGLSADQVNVILPGSRLPKLTPNTITRRDKLLAELSRVRDAGYAIVEEESRLGVSCIGAPVYDASQRIPFAISISTNPARTPPAALRKMLDELLKAADTLTVSFGGTPRHRPVRTPSLEAVR